MTELEAFKDDMKIRKWHECDRYISNDGEEEKILSEVSLKIRIDTPKIQG